MLLFICLTLWMNREHLSFHEFDLFWFIPVLVFVFSLHWLLSLCVSSWCLQIRLHLTGQQHNNSYSSSMQFVLCRYRLTQPSPLCPKSVKRWRACSCTNRIWLSGSNPLSSVGNDTVWLFHPLHWSDNNNKSRALLQKLSTLALRFTHEMSRLLSMRMRNANEATYRGKKTAVWLF